MDILLYYTPSFARFPPLSPFSKMEAGAFRLLAPQRLGRRICEPGLNDNASSS